jgi:hypothetical protein
MPLFELPDDLLTYAEEGFSDIIVSLGKTFRLTYPARFVECENCIFDPIGKKSSNRWRTGGPMPFHAGGCPMCNGQGRRATENYDDITMTINWTPSVHKMISDNIRIPMGYVIETRGYIADLPKIKSCEDIMILDGVQEYGKYKFKLEGEPVDAFQYVKGKFFNARLKRVG